MDGAEARDLYRPSGQEPGLDDSKYSNENFEGEEERFHVSGTCTWPAHPGSGSAVGSSGWKSTAASRGVGAFRPLKIRRTECAHAGRTHNASGLQGEQPLVDGTIALNVKVKKFNQARVNGGSNYDSLKRNHSQESGLGRISGKEDPVELDSSPTFANRTVKAWPIDPLDLEFEARGVRKVTTGITGLIHQVLDCSPTNRERELGLDRRETESGLEAAHRPPPDCRPSVGAGSQRRVSLAKSVPLMCTSLGQKHLAGALTPKELSFTVVSTATTAGKDLIEPASVKLETIMDHYCPKTVHGKGQRADMSTDGQSSWAKITQTVHVDFPSVHGCLWRTVLVYCRKSPNSPHGKGQRADMCTDVLSSWRKAPDSPRKGERAVMRIAVVGTRPRGENHPRTFFVGENHPRIVHGKGQRADMRTDGQSSWAKITGQSAGRASVLICVLADSPRGENHRTVHGRASVLICVLADSPRGENHPDSPRGENHPRTVLVAKITADSPREGPAC
ncbi:hypothetical protein Bca101_102109 [Brassica carinata]